MQLQRFATAGETSPELHNTRGVECTTGDGVDNLQPDPLDVLIKLKDTPSKLLFFMNSYRFIEKSSKLITR